jgi:membrane associated rhomboid family serine protease
MHISTPVVKTLVQVNLACFLITVIFASLNINVFNIFALWSPLSDNFFFWQFLTHLFLHGGLLHIIFNMLAIISLGTHVEKYLGSSQFLRFYLFCGVFASIFHILMTEFSDVPMVGASGAIFGIFSYFALVFPQEKLYAFFIPYGIRAKYLLGVLIAIELLLSFISTDDGIGHWAHIGGAIAGFIYYKFKIK